MGEINRRTLSKYLGYFGRNRGVAHRLAASTMFATLAMVRSASAGNDYWITTAGGNWETPGNWSLDALPNTSEAYFNTGSGTPYMVSLPGQETAQDVYVQGDAVTFNTASLSILGSLNVSAAAGQTTSLTVLGNSSSGISCDEGNYGGSINVGGTGTAYFTDNGVQLTDDRGSFNFGAGSVVSITNALLRGSGSSLNVGGVVTLSSAMLAYGITIGGPGPTGAILTGTVSNQSGDLDIGSGGIGTFNGSASIDNNINVGMSSAGTLTATGMVSGEEFNVGTAGTAGVLNVSGGSQVYSYLQFNLGSQGAVLLNGGLLSSPNFNFTQGSSFNFLSGTLQLLGGSLASPTLTVPSSATFQGYGIVTGSVINLGSLALLTQYSSGLNLTIDGGYNQSAASTLEIPLATGSGGFFFLLNEHLAVDGMASFAGTLDVTAPTGFPLTLGESFDVLSFISETGTFSAIDLPPLSGGLYWDLQDLYTTGTISVVPEPATGGLITLGAITLLSSPRRRRECGQNGA